ncbi:solute carrier family 23 member 2-like isoform X2 [Biomphalaria glabrata]|nr:solute carrier family 23 member 2-like isoform X2 [Biomphalaria glabrata]XP_055874427.1 solute carrier family 23 member 2-like isoform X2 [Biomphalaria glabrata]XP_055874428.1 solute carrier family 23 member 2-like isoform X2 [Biomphalaria glabrata]XP_055874429.1 solute carrier family 23 member 2-like isoform X2 [Biomphalaria glabrata]KAI8767996.1 solute carrier family 23 member 1 [Biomphalaria glabrata]
MGVDKSSANGETGRVKTEPEMNNGSNQKQTTDRKRVTNASTQEKSLDILYTVDQVPPWYLCIFLGFQQFLTAFGATFAYPVIISSAICIQGDDVGLGELISTVIFVSGFSSIIQTTFGIRLPIIQSISYSFIVPAFVVMSVSPDNCPYTDPKVNKSTLPPLASEHHRLIWKSNLCQLQGALMVASLLSIIIGFTGLIGFLMRYIGPLTIAPTISLIALSLFKVAADKGSTQWYICFMTIVLVAIFSQYLRNVGISCPCLPDKLRIFALFPVLLAIVISWIICLILTEAGVFPSEPDAIGYKARTDIRVKTLEDSSWFRFPYPGQWGVPTVSVAGVLGMLAAMLASIIESVGDYYACARLSGAPPPPGSAVSRGIGMEGITCLLAGAWGTGGGNTSYSENIGAIGITKVGSRAVIQVAGLIMIVLGCLGKFGALFVLIPEPIIGGLFYVMFGMVGAVGISNLQYVDLNSSRNLFVFGISIFFGLSVPNWVADNGIQTGNSLADQVLKVLFGTSMFVGGVLAFFLDNTIPGTREERGLLEWNKVKVGSEDEDLSVYDLPLIQKYLNRLACTKYIPFCPGSILDKHEEPFAGMESQELPTSVSENRHLETRI